MRTYYIWNRPSTLSLWISLAFVEIRCEGVGTVVLRDHEGGAILRVITRNSLDNIVAGTVGFPQGA